MQHKKIYLAGPIAGLTYGESALGWRAYVTQKLTGVYYQDGIDRPLESIQLDCYSPMRGKGFLRDIEPDHVLGQLEYKQSPVSTVQGILGRDRHDTMGADLIFMNLLGAKDKSIGTMVELGWADSLRKPVVLVMEDEGNTHEHIFVQGLVTYRVNNLDDAIACSKLILLPGE
jgi:hypothetical protein